MLQTGPVKKVTEARPGETAEVWVPERGGGPLKLRGTVEIEDLTGVLTCISSRSGANGPQNPVTQYILAQAAEHLAERLVEDVAPGRDGRESVPRTLSGSLGHQPFIESVLGMSQHQMLRRWPLALDWYTDVINYILRPSRFDGMQGSFEERMEEWTRGTLGDLIRSFADHLFVPPESLKVFRMSEALQSLWPDFPPVRNAYQAYRRQVNEHWVPMYEAALRVYGLRLRPGVDLTEVAWAFNALQARETFERLSDPDMPYHTAADGTRWSMTARSGLMIIAGAVVDADGRALSYDELVNRKPVR